MKDIREFTRSGRHNGVYFTVEIHAYEGGGIEAVAVTVDGLPRRPLSDGHRPVDTIDEAFEVGAELARHLIG